MPARYVVKNGCVYCGACVSSCPVQAVAMTNGGAVIDAAKCIGCGLCRDNCCVAVIEPIEAEDNLAAEKHSN